MQLALVQSEDLSTFKNLLFHLASTYGEKTDIVVVIIVVVDNSFFVVVLFRVLKANIADLYP